MAVNTVQPVPPYLGPVGVGGAGGFARAVGSGERASPAADAEQQGDDDGGGGGGEGGGAGGGNHRMATCAGSGDGVECRR